MKLPLSPFFIACAVFVGCTTIDDPADSPKDLRPRDRARSVKRTKLAITDAQLDKFDRRGSFTPNDKQRGRLLQNAGASPSFLSIVYDEPDGERSELGNNMAVRTGQFEVVVPHRYIYTDEELVGKRSANRQSTGWPAAHRRAAKTDYPSFMIDSDGKLWKLVSRPEVRDYFKKNQKKIGQVYVTTPTGTSNKDTFASEDKWRQFQKLADEFDEPLRRISRR